jgi:hypothetical protein
MSIRFGSIFALILMTASVTGAAEAAFERTFTGSGMRARVSIVRALVGRTILRVVLRTEDGHPVRHARIAVHVDMASMAMNPPGFAALHETRAGIYERAVTLTMPGHWKADLTIGRPSGVTSLSLPFFVDLP